LFDEVADADLGHQRLDVGHADVLNHGVSSNALKSFAAIVPEA
jgi:hypothetical protein